MKNQLNGRIFILHLAVLTLHLSKHIIQISDTMMTEEKLFNLSILEQIDDKNFIAQVIFLYLQDTHKDLVEMNRAFEAGELETVYKTAHKLKGSTAMLQANALFAILKETEKIAKAGVEIKKLATLVKTALYEFDQLKPALEFHLEGHEIPG